MVLRCAISHFRSNQGKSSPRTDHQGWSAVRWVAATGLSVPTPTGFAIWRDCQRKRGAFELWLLRGGSLVDFLFFIRHIRSTCSLNRFATSRRHRPPALALAATTHEKRLLATRLSSRSALNPILIDIKQDILRENLPDKSKNSNAVD